MDWGRWWTARAAGQAKPHLACPGMRGHVARAGARKRGATTKGPLEAAGGVGIRAGEGLGRFWMTARSWAFCCCRCANALLETTSVAR